MLVKPMLDTIEYGNIFFSFTDKKKKKKRRSLFLAKCYLCNRNSKRSLAIQNIVYQ